MIFISKVVFTKHLTIGLSAEVYYSFLIIVFLIPIYKFYTSLNSLFNCLFVYDLSKTRIIHISTPLHKATYLVDCMELCAAVNDSMFLTSYT